MDNKWDTSHDPVNHPKHYTNHPSGIEAIQITEHMGFCLGNAMKYIWRADLKNNSIEDLEKAIWYVQREIDKRKANGYESAEKPLGLIKKPDLTTAEQYQKHMSDKLDWLREQDAKTNATIY